MKLLKFDNNLENRLVKMGIELPKGSGPFGAYVPVKRAGGLIYVSGQLPMKDGKLLAAGAVPSRCSIEQARQAARQCVLNALGAVAAVEGSVNAIGSVIRVGAFVQSDAGFAEQPKVANGASDFLLELFFDAGQHVRAAVGVNALPLDAAVEIEFLFAAYVPSRAD